MLCLISSIQSTSQEDNYKEMKETSSDSISGNSQQEAKKERQKFYNKIQQLNKGCACGCKNPQNRK